MRQFLHMVAVVLACVAAACLPFLSGNVVCSASDGHFAVEPQHPEGSCDGKSHGDNEEKVPGTSQPCQDAPLIDLDAVMARGSDRAPSDMDAPLAHSFLLVLPDLYGAVAGTCSVSSASSEAPHAALRPLDPLRTVVLLI